MSKAGGWRRLECGGSPPPGRQGRACPPWRGVSIAPDKLDSGMAEGTGPAAWRGDAGAIAAEEQRGFVGQVVEERAGFGQEAVEPPGGASTPTGSRRFLPFLPWRLTMRAGFFTIYLSLCTV